MQPNFNPVSHGFVDVYVLAAERSARRTVRREQEIEINPVAKQIVEIRCRKRIVLTKPLLKACFEGAGLLRFQQWIRDGKESAAIPERLRKCGLLDSRCVREPDPCAGKHLASLERQQRQRCPRHELVSEAFVMHEAPSGNKRQPLETEHLLPEERVIAPHSTAREKRVSSSAVLVLKFVARGAHSPTALGVIGLIFKSAAVVIVNVVELKVFLAKRRLPGVLANGINICAVQRVIEARNPLLQA